MIQQDYLLRLIAQFIQAMLHARRVAGRVAEDEESADAVAGEGIGEPNPDPVGAAEMLEIAFGEAVDMDPQMLLVLAPESLASILQVSGTDAQLVPYLVECLELESEFLAQAGMQEVGDVRAAQAAALARAYNLGE